MAVQWNDTKIYYWINKIKNNSTFCCICFANVPRYLHFKLQMIWQSNLKLSCSLCGFANGWPPELQNELSLRSWQNTSCDWTELVQSQDKYNRQEPAMLVRLAQGWFPATWLKWLDTTSPINRTMKEKQPSECYMMWKELTMENNHIIQCLLTYCYSMIYYHTK